MENILTNIIIVLFIIFCIYFLYTFLDVLFLSKRRLRKTRSPEVKVEIKKEEKDSEDKEMNEDNKEDTVEVKLAQLKSAEDDKKEKSEKTSKIGLFSKLFAKKNEKAKKIVKKDNFKVNIVDDNYYKILEDFAKKTKYSWTQKEFYELILTLVTKGYDKKPSEINIDMDSIKTKYKLERDASDKNVSHSEVVSEEDEKDITMESSEPSEDEDIDSEKELKKLMSKNKESEDTRDQINKTLDEIRALRERLNNVD